MRGRAAGHGGDPAVRPVAATDRGYEAGPDGRAARLFGLAYDRQGRWARDVETLAALQRALERLPHAVIAVLLTSATESARQARQTLVDWLRQFDPEA